MWRYRNILHKILSITWRLLLSLFRAWSKLSLGNATCGGSAGPAQGSQQRPGGHRFRRGQAAARRRKQHLQNDLHSFGSASFNPAVARFAGSGQRGRKAGVHSGWANPGGAVGLFGAARRQRFGGPAGSRADPDGSPGNGREARSQDRAVSGRGGRLGEGFWFSRVPGVSAARLGLPSLQGSADALQASAGGCKGSPDGSGPGGQKPPEASGSCPARARQASDLGPARLTPLFIFSPGFCAAGGSGDSRTGAPKR